MVIAVSFSIHLRYPGSLYWKQFGMIEQSPFIYVMLKIVMVLNMPKKDEISPSLRHILCQFSGEMPVPAETDFAGISPEQTFELIGLDVMMHLTIVESGDGS